jgi:hypothetical protein
MLIRWPVSGSRGFSGATDVSVGGVRASTGSRSPAIAEDPGVGLLGNACAKPYAGSSAPQAVKGAAARLPALGPDGPPLTAWLRFALGQRRVARTRNPRLSRGFLPFWGGCAPLLQYPRGGQRRVLPGPRVAEPSLTMVDSPTHGYVSRSDFRGRAARAPPDISSLCGCS